MNNEACLTQIHLESFRFKDRKKCQLHVGATLPPPPPPPLPPPEQVPGCNTASKSGRGLARLDKLLAGIHGKLMKGERGDHIRKAMGAGPVAKQNVRKFQRRGGRGRDEGRDEGRGGEGGGVGGGGGGVRGGGGELFLCQPRCR